jgi:hypothetical protein
MVAASPSKKEKELLDGRSGTGLLKPISAERMEMVL